MTKSVPVNFSQWCYLIASEPTLHMNLHSYALFWIPNFSFIYFLWFLYNVNQVQWNYWWTETCCYQRDEHQRYCQLYAHRAQRCTWHDDSLLLKDIDLREPSMRVMYERNKTWKDVQSGRVTVLFDGHHCWMRSWHWKKRNRWPALRWALLVFNNVSI